MSKIFSPVLSLHLRLLASQVIAVAHIGGGYLYARRRLLPELFHNDSSAEVFLKAVLAYRSNPLTLVQCILDTDYETCKFKPETVSLWRQLVYQYRLPYIEDAEKYLEILSDWNNTSSESREWWEERLKSFRIEAKMQASSELDKYNSEPPVYKTCNTCNGTGLVSHSESCSECNGKGRVVTATINKLVGYEDFYGPHGQLCHRNYYQKQIREGFCLKCSGTGRKTTSVTKCYPCNGTGRIDTRPKPRAAGEIFQDLVSFFPDEIEKKFGGGKPNQPKKSIRTIRRKHLIVCPYCKKELAWKPNMAEKIIMCCYCRKTFFCSSSSQNST